MTDSAALSSRICRAVAGEGLRPNIQDLKCGEKLKDWSPSCISSSLTKSSRNVNFTMQVFIDLCSQVSLFFGRPSGRSRPSWPLWRNGGCWAPWSPRPPRSTRGSLSRYESPGFYKPGLFRPHPHQRFLTLAETEIISGLFQKHQGLCLPQTKDVGLSDGGTQASAIIKTPHISNTQPGLTTTELQPVNQLLGRNPGCTSEILSQDLRGLVKDMSA